jgi:hypothetical protein
MNTSGFMAKKVCNGCTEVCSHCTDVCSRCTVFCIPFLLLIRLLKIFSAMAKEVVISNSSLNSHGSRILTAGIHTAQFQRNPILLWAHNRPWRGTTDEVLPIGRVENLRIDGDNLIGTPVFDEKDEFALKIKQKFEDGFLKMVSAGLDVIETSDDPIYILPGQRRATITKSKLLEVSIVDIGANDDALTLYKDGKILNLAAGADSAVVPEIQTTLEKDLNDNQMKTIAVKLGLPETATEAEILSKIGLLQTDAATSVTLKKELDTQKEKMIETQVEAAIKLKKVTADKRSHFIELGKAVGMESLKTTLDAISPAVKPTDVIHAGGGAAGSGEYKKLSDVPDKERIELRKNDRAVYVALYKAEYGLEPEIND